jgi:hypothetical protein
MDDPRRAELVYPHAIGPGPEDGLKQRGNLPVVSQGLRRSLNLLDGFAGQRTDYCFRVYVISIIFHSLPPR